jgi:hypothetical protein
VCTLYTFQVQLKTAIDGTTIVYNKESGEMRVLDTQCDDYVVTYTMSRDNERREFIASRTGKVKPVWVDRLFREAKPRQAATELPQAAEKTQKQQNQQQQQQ